MLATDSRLPAASVRPRLHWIDWLRVAAIASVFLLHTLRPSRSITLALVQLGPRNPVSRVLLGAWAQPAGPAPTYLGRIAEGQPPAALEARHG